MPLATPRARCPQGPGGWVLAKHMHARASRCCDCMQPRARMHNWQSTEETRGTCGARCAHMAHRCTLHAGMSIFPCQSLIPPPRVLAPQTLHAASGNHTGSPPARCSHAAVRSLFGTASLRDTQSSGKPLEVHGGSLQLSARLGSPDGRDSRLRARLRLP